MLENLGWSVTAAAIAWGLTLSWAKAAMVMSRDAMQEEVDKWKAEALRARQMVAQLKTEAAMWARGRQDGREDLIAMMPLLLAAQNDPTNGRAKSETKTNG
jgi:Cys-tRNA synthase (O-phospho-L-seryl-tRNA:Cys-tRNA synthase)